MIETAEKPRVKQTQHEGWALGWLTFGLLTAWLGATIGTYLVLRSTRWSLRWKVVVLGLPLALVATLKFSPVDLADSIGLVELLLVVVAAALLAHVALGAAERAQDQSRLPVFASVVVAVVGVAIAGALLGKIHAIDSYDLRDDAIAIAQAADGAGEEFGVIQDNNTWLESDGPTPAQLAELVGPGNARFVQLYDEAMAKVDDEPWGSSKELGTCHVFPVVTSSDAGMESVEGIARFCDGPSQASGYVTLTDR